MVIYVLLNTLALSAGFWSIFDKVAREAAIFILQTSFNMIPSSKLVRVYHHPRILFVGHQICLPSLMNLQTFPMVSEWAGTFLILGPHRHVEVLRGVRQWLEVAQSRQLAIVIPLQGAKGEPLVNLWSPISLCWCDFVKKGHCREGEPLDRRKKEKDIKKSTTLKGYESHLQCAHLIELFGIPRTWWPWWPQWPWSPAECPSCGSTCPACPEPLFCTGPLPSIIIMVSCTRLWQYVIIVTPACLLPFLQVMAILHLPQEFLWSIEPGSIGWVSN